MFKYSKMAGILSVVMLVLAVIPALSEIFAIPGLPESVPMSFSGGEVSRWGSRYELFAPGVIALAFGLAIYLQTRRKMASFSAESANMARLVAERYMRNGAITMAVLNLANIYLLVSVTGSLASMG